MRAICKNNSRLLLCPFHRVVIIHSEACQLFYLLRIQFWKVSSWVYNLDVRTRQEGERLNTFNNGFIHKFQNVLTNTKATKLSEKKKSLRASLKNVLWIISKAQLRIQNWSKILKMFHNFNLLTLKWNRYLIVNKYYYFVYIRGGHRFIFLI